MDLAASLPIAAAFRELLEMKGDRCYWKADYKLVFQVAAEELYKALLNKLRTTKGVNSLGADTEYRTQASNIVLRAKDEVLSRGTRPFPEEVGCRERRSAQHKMFSRLTLVQQAGIHHILVLLTWDH